MVDKQVRIDLTATDNASKVVEDVADAVEDLEKSEPKLEIGADGAAAEKALDEVRADAEKLDGETVRLIVEAPTSTAQGNLADLRGDLDKTGEKADETARKLNKVDSPGGGANLRGQAIADLTGPLGEASSAASDLAGVFDGISDIAEGVAAKVGVSAAGMSTAIGGIGFAIIAATTLWGLFTDAQEKARRKQKELVDGQQKLNDKIKDAKFADAATEFEKLYGGALRAAEQLGVPTQELVDFITGVTDSAPTAVAALQTVEDAGAQMGATFVNGKLVSGTAVAGMVQTITDARGQFETTNGVLDQSATKSDELADALRRTAGQTDDAADAQNRLKDAAKLTQDGFDHIRASLDMGDAFDTFYADMLTAMEGANSATGVTKEEIRSIKDDILNVAEFAKLSPIEVQTLLDRVDAGDYAGVKDEIEAISRNNPAIISLRLAKVTVPMQGGGVFGQQIVGTVTQQTIYVPMGSQGPQVRRAGARFGNRMANGARR